MSLAFNGEYVLPVPLERVWRGLNDPETLRRSIAGCSALDRTSEHEFMAVMTARVGPISVNFRGHVQIEDIEDMKAYTLVVQAQGGAAGFGRMNARIELQPVSAHETRLKYGAQADVGGKLASVGQRLIQSVAQKQADDFFKRFIAVLTGVAQETDPPKSADSSHEGTPVIGRANPDQGHSSSGLGAPVPAWLVIFGAAMGIALGYCLALLR